MRARVDMAKAAASIIMGRKLKGDAVDAPGRGFGARTTRMPSVATYRRIRSDQPVQEAERDLLADHEAWDRDNDAKLRQASRDG
jgi:hypothetical protein